MVLEIDSLRTREGHGGTASVRVRKGRGGEYGKRGQREVNFVFSQDNTCFSVTSDRFWHLMRLNTIFISLRLGLWFTKD